MSTWLEYGLLFFLDILIRIYIFQQISGFQIKRKNKIIIVFMLTLASILLSRAILLWEPFSLLLAVSFLKIGWNRTQKIFYCLLPFVIGDMFQRLIALYLRFVFDIDITSLNNSPYFNVLLILLLIPFYIIFFKGLRIDAKNLQVDTLDQDLKKTFIGMNIFFITYFLIIRSIVQLEVAIDNGLNLNIDTYFIRTNILLIYFILFTSSMLYLNYQKKEKQDREIQELKDKQLSDLGRYSRHVESLYKEIRSFKHDYTNILISLNEAIKGEDIVAIRSIYQEVIADSDKKFYDRKFDIARLSNIQNTAVKSLVSSKMFEAQNKGIEISVEVDDDIEPPSLELIEFITILSILLDNAIDAAEQCTNGNIVFAYFHEENRKIVVVENTTVEAKVSTSPIFEYGYSSKGDDRGIGLANVKAILNNYPKSSLSTNSHNHRFVQELTFIN